MKTILIRHGKTMGNLEGRYIGCRTDEPLCEQGIKELEKVKLPLVELVFASPMRRCLETAAILYPGIQTVIVDDFRECDFGLFEGKNYTELNGIPEYQAWIDSNGELPFPGGESRSSVEWRVIKAYRDLIKTHEVDTCAVIAHGGTLMSIMAGFAKPRGLYFSYQVKNGEGFILEADGRWRTLFHS